MDRNRSRSTNALAAAIAALILIAAPFSLAQQQSPIVLHTSTEQIPLKAYAEMMRAGFLQITSGSAKDIPTVADVRYFRCALTGWAPAGFLATLLHGVVPPWLERLPDDSGQPLDIYLVRGPS